MNKAARLREELVWDERLEEGDGPTPYELRSWLIRTLEIIEEMEGKGGN